MRWFTGQISEAIKLSQNKGAIFVVYIEGTDEKSQKISKLIDDVVVSTKLTSDKFVAIKLEANSLPHRQFSEIYKQTPVPAIYFIGACGEPVKIITESSTSENLAKEIDEILEKDSSSASTSSQNLINSEQIQKPSNVVCENGVCTIKKVSPETGDASGTTNEDKIERAKKLLEEKRQEKQNQEKENEKLKELERRKMGQEVQKLKKWQEDQELKQMMEEREKDRRLEKEAREKVLAQIAQDKAERAAKFAPTASSTPQNKETAQAPPITSTNKQESNTARLQFKLPDGSSRTQEFSSYDKMQTVINYIKANLNLPFTNFTLSTTFPRRQFSESDYSQTLVDLQLTPNAVVLILPINSGTVSTSSASGGISGFLWTLFVPFLQLFNIIKAFIFGGDSNYGTGGDGAPSSSTATGRSSNSVIHVRSKYDLDNRLKSAGSKLVVIDFFATWCGPCRMIAPELERMAKEFSNVVFLKVDVDENGDIAREYRVSAMPTFVFIKNRRELTKFSGADSYQLKSTIQRYR